MGEIFSPIVSSSRSDLLYSCALPHKIICRDLPAISRYFLSSFHVFQAVFSLANKICFICRYERERPEEPGDTVQGCIIQQLVHKKIPVGKKYSR